MITSIFRHGSQTNRTHEQLLYLRTLQVPKLETPGATDLSAGMDIVFDNLIPDIMDQVEGLVLKKLRTRVIMLGSGLFSRLDDDMALRFNVQKHLAETSWKVPVPLKQRKVHVNMWGDIYLTVVIGDLTHKLFDDMPILKEFIRPNTMYQWKIGEGKYDPVLSNIYVEGEIYLYPYMLL